MDRRLDREVADVDGSRGPAPRPVHSTPPGRPAPDRQRRLRLVDRDGTRRGIDDADLMRAIHDEHARPLWRYVLRLTSGDAARAEDVVQETLLRAWRSPAVLDQSEGSARSWLFTVARRIVIDEWRTARAQREVTTGEVPDVAVPDRTQASEDRSLVVQALARLSHEHRQVLVQCYVQDASVTEAALVLGIPAGTVKSRTHYALRAFGLALEELGATGDR